MTNAEINQVVTEFSAAEAALRSFLDQANKLGSAEERVDEAAGRLVAAEELIRDGSSMLRTLGESLLANAEALSACAAELQRVNPQAINEELARTQAAIAEGGRATAENGRHIAELKNEVSSLATKVEAVTASHLTLRARVVTAIVLSGLAAIASAVAAVAAFL